MRCLKDEDVGIRGELPQGHMEGIYLGIDTTVGLKNEEIMELVCVTFYVLKQEFLKLELLKKPTKQIP